MKRIEFMGCHGVGKTTLYNNMLASRTNNNIWYTPIEVQMQLAKSIAMKKKTVSGLIQYIGLRMPRINVLLRRTNLTNNLYVNSFLDNNFNYQEFIKEYLHFNNSNGQEKVLYLLYHYRDLLSVLETIALFEDYLEHTNCVVYEVGVVNRVASVINREQIYDNKNIVESLLDKMPIPDGVIYLDADIDIVCNRLISRESEKQYENKEIPFRDLSNDEIYDSISNSMEVIRYVIDYLGRRGVDIIKICSNENISNKQIRNINDFINKNN